MKISRKPKGSAGKVLQKVRSKLVTKKSLLLIIVLLLLFIFCVGIFAGMLVTEFFGTLNNPAKQTLVLMEKLEVPIFTLHRTLSYIVNENIRIPVNALKAQFVKTEKVYLDISWEDYQKLAFKREESLERGLLVTTDDDFVPLTITYNGETLSAEARLKGDMLDHLESDKWSFRIKVKDDQTFKGMKVFSLQQPSTRNHVHNLFFHNVLLKEGLISARTGFVEVFINGERKGIYNYEEHFEKRLVENNQRREGVIVKYNEQHAWNKIEAGRVLNHGTHVNDAYYTAEVDSFQTGKVLEDPALSEQFAVARTLLELFKTEELSTSEVFDVNQLARFYALLDLFGGSHGVSFNNQRFYFNPVTTKLEPIGFDIGPGNREPELVAVAPGTWSNVKPLFNDIHFYEKYLNELERVSQDEYLDALLSEQDQFLDQMENIVRKDEQLYYFSPRNYYLNKGYIQKYLSPLRQTTNYLSSINQSNATITLLVGNVQQLPIVVDSISFQGATGYPITQKTDQEEKRVILSGRPEQSVVKYTPITFAFRGPFANKSFDNISLTSHILGTQSYSQEVVFPWPILEQEFVSSSLIRKESQIFNHKCFQVDKKTRRIILKKGVCIITQSLIIPEGYTVYGGEGSEIIINNESTVASFSPLQLVGSRDEPIVVTSSDGTGQGLVVLQSSKPSELQNVEFRNNAAPNREGWRLTGAVTFYESPVMLNRVVFSNNNAEDSLNIIRSNFSVNNSLFEKSTSDMIDVDFGQGIISNSIFLNCGNDCIDISGSYLEANNVVIQGAGDKGFSAGEASEAAVQDMIISNAFIGIASKDRSSVRGRKVSMNNNSYEVAAYQKKPEFGPGVVNIEEFFGQEESLENNETLFLKEEGSEIVINGHAITRSYNNVYELIYGAEE